jgi:DinB superfamily
MEFNLSQTITLLDHTPAALNAFLRNLPEPWILQNEGEKSWNVFDIIGHLIHGERTDWIPRAKMILEFGETKSFVPFDRWAQEKESQGKSLSQLLDEFTRARSASLQDLRSMNLQPADLAKRGRHPRLGVVNLSQLLSAWTVHDLTHLHQISRVMAYQYQDAVGPWQKYLGVLHCAGHSE